MQRLVVTLLFAGVLNLPAFANTEEDLLAMAPAGSTLLTGIDITRTQSSPLGAYLLTTMRSEDPHYRAFLSSTGFDPNRDLDQVLVAGVAGAKGPNSRFAILARGTFDSQKIQNALLAKGSIASSVNGVQTWLIHQPRNNSDVALAFPKAGLAVLADPATLQEILSPRVDGQALDPQLLEQANRIGAANDVWFATLMSGTFLGRELSSGAAKSPLANSNALQSILKSAGGMQFGNTVALSLDLFTRSPEDAQSVGDLLRFAGSLMQMQKDPRANAAALALAGLQVQNSGPTVHASLDLTQQQLQQFLSSGRTGQSARQ